MSAAEPSMQPDRRADTAPLAGCRYSCPPDLLLDDDPLSRARRSTLARIFGARATYPRAIAASTPSSSSDADRDRIPWGFSSFPPHRASVGTNGTAANTGIDSVDSVDASDGAGSPIAVRSPSSDTVLAERRRREALAARQAAALNALNRSVSDQTPASDEIIGMRDQVRLLMRNLEEEKKRRASEQKLMQQKILELQSLIRRNFPEQQKALERRMQSSSSTSPTVSASATRATSHPRIRVVRSTRATLKTLKPDRRRERVSSSDELTDEDASERDLRDEGQGELSLDELADSGDDPEKDKDKDESHRQLAKQQLTKNRSKMHSMVLQAQQEARTLKLQLVDERRSFEQRERQLRSESLIHMAQLEEKHKHTQSKLSHAVSTLTSEVASLTEDKHRMAQELEAQAARIRELEEQLQSKASVEQAVQP